MKKVLSVILTVTMLLSASLVFADETSIGFGAEVDTTTEGIYRELKTHEDGNLIASVVVPASVFAGGVETANLYVAAYGESGELSAVSVKEVTSSDAGTSVKTPTISVKDTDTVRAFIWDGTTLTPIATKALPKKETMMNFTFEDYALGAITTDTTTITKATGATIVDDPDSAGDHGQVLKLLGEYDADTGKGTTAASLTVYKLRNDLGNQNSSARKEKGLLAVDYEFDIYIPSDFAYKDAEDNDAVANTVYNFQFGDSAMAHIRLGVSKETNRFIVYDQQGGGSVYNNTKYTNLYDRWIPVKVETRPYFETSVDSDGNTVETVNENYSEIFVYFDNQQVYHKLDSTYTSYTKALTNWGGCEGRIYISGIDANNSYSRAIYIDNLRASF